VSEVVHSRGGLESRNVPPRAGMRRGREILRSKIFVTESSLAHQNINLPWWRNPSSRALKKTLARYFIFCKIEFTVKLYSCILSLLRDKLVYLSRQNFAGVVKLVDT